MANVYRANDQRVQAKTAWSRRKLLLKMTAFTHTFDQVPLYDAAGGAYAVCGISTDITERKRMENIRNALNKEKNS